LVPVNVTVAWQAVVQPPEPAVPLLGEIVKLGASTATTAVALSAESETVQEPVVELVVTVTVPVWAPAFTVWLTSVHGELTENVVPLVHDVPLPLSAICRLPLW
jgi:hypothetical protein